MVGGTIGYNWQTGPAVFGVEADLDWARINGTTAGCFTGNCFTQMQAFGTARGGRTKLYGVNFSIGELFGLPPGSGPGVFWLDAGVPGFPIP